MSEFIETAYIEFHNEVDSPVTFDFVDEGKHFGILRIQLKKAEITQTPIVFVFTIDISGSMNECDAGNNNSKMDYVKQTFKNMLRFFSQQHANIKIRVALFNDTASLLIDTVRVTPENYTKITDDIMAIQAEGCTNIEGALTLVSGFMKQYKDSNPNHTLVHVFMSDGDATVGKKNTKQLVELVCTDYNNVFIGFGDSHNATLLRRLSQDKGCDYQFVNHMESSNLIYGETIHKFLYGVIEHPTIRFKNAVIYNWKKNSWDSELTEDAFVSETEKIYHVMTSVNPEFVEGKILGKSDEVIDTLLPLPDLVGMDGTFTCKTDLTRYMFRQEVLTLLFRVSNEVESKRELKSALKKLFQRIRQYMRQHLLNDDSFMRLLCDDLSVTYKTIDDMDGIMYATARQGSQGNQQNTVCTPIRRNSDQTNVFTYDSPSTPVRRNRGSASAFTYDTQTFDEFDNDPSYPVVLSLLLPTTNVEEFTDSYDNLDDYTESGGTTSCYATLSAIDTLTQINTNM